MRTVLKYPLVGASGQIELPPGARVIYAGFGPIPSNPEQPPESCVWVEFDPANQGRNVVLEWAVYGTGHPQSDALEHIATVATRTLPWADNALVWHLYGRVR